MKKEENTTRKCIALYLLCTLCVPFAQRHYTFKISSLDTTYPLKPNQIERDNPGVFFSLSQVRLMTVLVSPSFTTVEEYFTLLRSPTTYTQSFHPLLCEVYICSRHLPFNYLKTALLLSIHTPSLLTPQPFLVSVSLKTKTTFVSLCTAT